MLERLLVSRVRLRRHAGRPSLSFAQQSDRFAIILLVAAAHAT